MEVLESLIEIVRYILDRFGAKVCEPVLDEFCMMLPSLLTRLELVYFSLLTTTASSLIVGFGQWAGGFITTVSSIHCKNKCLGSEHVTKHSNITLFKHVKAFRISIKICHSV